MHDGAIEPTVVPRNPLDVLAQQIVATAAERRWQADELYALVRRAENFAELGRDSFEAVLAMLAGHYPAPTSSPSCGRASSGTARRARSRAGATRGRWRSSRGGTIPDRGLFGVYLVDDGDGRRPASTKARAARGGGRRVGELDEEMVYETREGEVILLGASAWRIEQITHDRVLVSPAPGQPGKVPFWKGDGPGRPIELGRALGRVHARDRRSGARPARAGARSAREAAA